MDTSNLPASLKEKALMGKIGREGIESFSGRVRRWAGVDVRRHQEGLAGTAILPGRNGLESRSWL